MKIFTATIVVILKIFGKIKNKNDITFKSNGTTFAILKFDTNSLELNMEN